MLGMLMKKINESLERKDYLISLGNELRECYDVHKDREKIEKLSVLIGEDILKALSATAEDHFDPYW